MIRGTIFSEILQDDPHESTNLNDNDDKDDASMQSINQISQDLSANENGEDDDLINSINDDEDDVGANTPFSFDDDDEDTLLPESAKRDDVKLKLTQKLNLIHSLMIMYHS